MGTKHGKTSKHGRTRRMFDDADLDALTDVFRGNRREHGVSQADRDWIEEALDEWLDHLEHGNDDIGLDTAAAFAVGMHETLSIRDMLVISLVADAPACPKGDLLDFVTHPHAVKSRRTMERVLTTAFEEGEPDVERCQTGLGMLMRMVDILPTSYCVQPLAVIAYMLWWIGDERAAAVALYCLSLDEDCSLAAMVFSAVSRGVTPHCCKDAGREEEKSWE